MRRRNATSRPRCWLSPRPSTISTSIPSRICWLGGRIWPTNARTCLRGTMAARACGPSYSGQAQPMTAMRRSPICVSPNS